MPFMQDKEVFTKLIGEIGRHVTAPTVAAPEGRAFLFCAPLLTSGQRSDQCRAVPQGQGGHSGDDLQSIEIMKEYGPDNLYFRKSDIAAGKAEDGIFKIAIIDDVLATGGTAEGIAKALDALKITVDGKEYGVKVTEFIFLAELDGLYGRNRLKIAPVYSIAHVK